MSRRSRKREYGPWMIVKVQVPLIGDPELCLITNRDGTMLHQLPIPATIIETIGTKMKGYFHARVRQSDNMLVINPNPAPAQHW